MSKQYLYNGVKLPALPEYDQSVYPYVILQRLSMTGGDIYYFTGRSTPFTRADDYTAEQPDGTTATFTDVMNLYDPEGCFEYRLNDTTGEWAYIGDPSQVVSSATEVIFWTNKDIYEDDGSVFLAGSDPVPASTFSLRSWLTGFALGFSGKPLPLNTGKKIVAYSYNGTVLPKLPEWDKTVYPYAVIYTSGSKNYIMVSQEAPYVATGSGDKKYCYIEGYWMWYWVDAGTNDWYLYTAQVSNGIYSGGTSVSAEKLVWSSHDIADTDNSTVYLAASEPVPVYE